MSRLKSMGSSDKADWEERSVRKTIDAIWLVRFRIQARAKSLSARVSHDNCGQCWVITLNIRF